MDKRQRHLFLSLDYNLEKNMDKASAAAELLFKERDLSKNAKINLRKALILIGNDYSSKHELFQAIKYYDKGRFLSKFSLSILKKEVTEITQLYLNIKDLLVQNDIRILLALIDLILLPYASLRQINFFLKSVNELLELKISLEKQLKSASADEEGKVTYQLQNLIRSFYEDWSEEEIAEEWSKTLVPAIRRIIEDKPDNSDASTEDDNDRSK